MRRLSLAAAAATCFAVTNLCGAQQEPATFDAAWEQAQGVVDTMRAARAAVSDLQARLGQETDQTVRADLEKKLDVELKSVAKIRQDLATKVEGVLKLAAPTTAIEDLNRVRYLKCYLKYDKGDYVEAAEQGEFVSMRYPASEVARPCATIALASYLQLYKAKKTDAAKMLLLANHIVATWPNHPDAAMARGALDLLK
jgi:hypothetical protein